MGKMQCAYKWYIIIENFVFCCHLTRHNWFYHFQLLSVNPHKSIQVVEQWLVLPETGQQAFAHLAAQQVMILLEVQVQLARMMEMEIRQDSGLIHGRSVSVSSSLLHQHLLVWCIANDSHCKPPFQNLWSCYRTCCFHYSTRHCAKVILPACVNDSWVAVSVWKIRVSSCVCGLTQISCADSFLLFTTMVGNEHQCCFVL